MKKGTTCANFTQVQMEGNRQITRDMEFYNLDAIIAVGYRVNSVRATAFRQWATAVLRDFALRGYVIDKKRMENGAFLGEDFAENEFEKFRIRQDQLFESDFDKELKLLGKI